jgi:hypothetical protein
MCVVLYDCAVACSAASMFEYNRERGEEGNRKRERERESVCVCVKE